MSLPNLNAISFACRCLFGIAMTGAAQAADGSGLTISSELSSTAREHQPASNGEAIDEPLTLTLTLTLTRALDASKLLRGQLTRAEYDATILAARSGQIDAAIRQLQSWQTVYPDDKRIVYDLAALLDGAGDYEGALKFDKQILNGDSPAYAINAIAHAARSSGHARQAETAYQLVLKKTPNDNEAHAGVAYAWMAQDRLQSASEYVTAHLPSSAAQYKRDDVPLLVALAEIEERRKEWLRVANIYQQVLRFEPGFAYAIRGRVFALANAGMPFLAKRLADQHQEIFNADEKFRLENDAVAQTIRFGQAQLSTEEGRTRYTTTDSALTKNADVTNEYGDRPVAQFDRLVALRNRSRMHEVVQQYELLRAAGVTVPVYARFAVADAYLSLHQPELARDLYANGLKEINAGAADNFNVQVSLIYAYQEAEQQKEAMRIAENLLAHTPTINYQGIRGIEEPNPEYARALLLKAILNMYNDRLAEAEKSMRDLRVRAPFNPEVRSAWASLQMTRDHPRAARDELSSLLVDTPTSVEVAADRAEVLLSLNQFSEAHAELTRLSAQQPDNQSVKNLARKIGIYDSPSFNVETVVGRGGSEAGAESLYGAALYSAPLSNSLGDRYRLFSRLQRASGQTRNGETETRTRFDIGTDYRYRDLTVDAAITRTLDTAATGMMLTISRDLSDAWQARAALDTNVIDLPAAAVHDGVKAEALKLGLTWTLNEARQISGELSRTEFSDGNDRNAMHVSWQERWIANEKYKLDTVTTYATSGNNLAARDYFNPTRDRELSLSFKNEWLTWRRYQRSFKQRAIVTAGQYWQQGFAAGTLADLHVEHEWNRDDGLGVQYGIGRSFHPYDGNRDYRSYFYLNVFGHFK
jgi:biofilm PGA synthesis protein PgaA